MAYGRSGTLVANTPTSVTVRGWDNGVWVINRTASTEIWVRLDGTAATVAGADCFCVSGARNFPTPNANVTLSLISTGTPDYSVEGAVPVAVV